MRAAAVVLAYLASASHSERIQRRRSRPEGQSPTEQVGTDVQTLAQLLLPTREAGSGFALGPGHKIRVRDPAAQRSRVSMQSETAFAEETVLLKNPQYVVSIDRMPSFVRLMIQKDYNKLKAEDNKRRKDRKKAGLPEDDEYDDFSSESDLLAMDDETAPEFDWEAAKDKKKRTKKSQYGVRDDDEEDLDTEIQGGGRLAKKRGRSALQELEFALSGRQSQTERQRQKVEVVSVEKIRLDATMTVGDLAKKLDLGAAQVITTLMKQGVMANVMQSVTYETAKKVCVTLGREVAEAGEEIEAESEAAEVSVLGVVDDEEADDEEDLVKRPPVVTIMGHVDHGKTTLLDAMRTATIDKTVSVAEGEAGGITQHIGAYSVEMPDGKGKVTFLDTPGHAAFNAMRSRGAEVTDIVVLAVAANDGIMPQTLQSIDAAKQANVPIIVAFTKSDLEGADTKKIKMQLLENEVVTEEFGGDVLTASVSAKTGDGLEDLFELISMQGEILELTANPKRRAIGSVLEARREEGRGTVATVLIQRGTLEIGDLLVAGATSGRARSLMDDKGISVSSAGPSDAVEITGLDGLPEAGDPLTVVINEAAAQEMVESRQEEMKRKRQTELYAGRQGAEMFKMFNASKKDLPSKTLDFVVKADVQGSAEALTESIKPMTIADDLFQVKTRVLRSAVGAVTPDDVKMASVTGASIIAFNAPVPAAVKMDADAEGVTIHEYKIVYDILDVIEVMMGKEIRPPPSKTMGKFVGTLNVKQVFNVNKPVKTQVAGCEVVDGFVRVGSNIRILRGLESIYEGKLKTLRLFKDLVEQVDAPSDCGISFEDFESMQEGDRVEVYATGSDDDLD